MIQFKRNVAEASRIKVRKNGDILDGTINKFTKVINSSDYQGTIKELANIKKIYNLNDDLLTFITDSITMYDDIVEKNSTDVSKLESSLSIETFESQLASLIPNYNDNGILNTLSLEYLRQSQTLQPKLFVKGRETTITNIGNTKCLISVPICKDENGKSIDCQTTLTVLAPGATECKEDKFRNNKFLSKYMGGIFSENGNNSELNSIIVMPFQFTGGVSFETNGEALSDKGFELYAKFINDAANETYTNSRGQMITVDADNVQLIGFSQGTIKQLELVNRIISDDPKYDKIKENLGDVHFNGVTVASAGVSSTNNLYNTIKNGKAIEKRLNEFKENIVYVTSEGDKFDLNENNRNGAKYTNVNNQLKDMGLLNEELSKEYIESLPTELQGNMNKNRNYSGRTCLIAVKSGYDGHESTREALPEIMMLRQNKTATNFIAKSYTVSDNNVSNDNQTSVIAKNNNVTTKSQTELLNDLREYNKNNKVSYNNVSNDKQTSDTAKNNNVTIKSQAELLNDLRQYNKNNNFAKGLSNNYQDTSQIQLENIENNSTTINNPYDNVSIDNSNLNTNNQNRSKDIKSTIGKASMVGGIFGSIYAAFKGLGKKKTQEEQVEDNYTDDNSNNVFPDNEELYNNDIEDSNNNHAKNDYKTREIDNYDENDFNSFY